MENECICFIKYVGKDNDNLNVYEFLFSDSIEEVWGDNFEYMPMGLCHDLSPYEEYITSVKEVKTEISFKLIQDSLCNSFQDCIDHCVALAYEDLTNYEEYPEERGRIVIQFGETYEDIEEKLAKCNILMD